MRFLLLGVLPDFWLMSAIKGEAERSGHSGGPRPEQALAQMLCIGRALELVRDPCERSTMRVGPGYRRAVHR